MHASDPQSQNPFRNCAARLWMIPAMVFGYIIWWPIGLALTFCMIFGDRWFRQPIENIRAWHDEHHAGRGTRWTHPGATRSSGNEAFDAYRADVLKRLEEEQQKFEDFLARLRTAKDKTEFDAFMAEQARRVSAGRALPKDDLDDDSPVEYRA